MDQLLWFREWAYSSIGFAEIGLQIRHGCRRLVLAVMALWPALTSTKVHGHQVGSVRYQRGNAPVANRCAEIGLLYFQDARMQVCPLDMQLRSKAPLAHPQPTSMLEYL